MKNSAIQWTDHTFNPWEGCAKVAPECKNCYAETLSDHRFGRVKWGKGQPRRRTSPAAWRQPIHWNEEAGIEGWQRQYPVGYRPRVFCLSLGDWLDEEVPIAWLADLMIMIHRCDNLDWLLLTKRPENWKERLQAALISAQSGNDLQDEVDWEWLESWIIDKKPPHNVWVGVSAGADQKAALDIPSKIHFLSCEPMLHAFDPTHAKGFDWIIFGGESGKNARPCDVDWIRQGLTFCRANHIAPFVKQLGRVVITNGVTGPDQHWPRTTGLIDNGKGHFRKHLIDSHGGDMEEWPIDLRHREFPTIR